MPVFEIESPTGEIFEVEAPEGATSEQAFQFFKQSQQPPAQPKPKFSGSGIIEPALTIATGVVAEPIAGFAGIAQAINPFAEEGAGARAVEATREALTFQPRTQAGQESLQAVGTALQPIGEALTGAEKFLGDTVFEATNSPTLAAVASSLPTAILETIGLKGSGRIVKSTKTVEPSQKAIRKSLTEAAPAPEDLKTISRGIFKELDESGVKIRKRTYKKAVTSFKEAARKQGLSKRTTPRAFGLIEDLEEVIGTSPSLSEIDDLRTVANGVAKSLDRTEAAIGSRVVQEMDAFLDNITEESIVKGSLEAGEVAPKYKAARNLWGRARKSEVIVEAVEKATRRASGFENGLRVEFDKILNNKKINRFFRESELDAMRDLVKGDRSQNLAKLIGRLGFGEGRATNVVGGLLGSFAGTAAGGLPGFVTTVAVGSTSRKLAQKLTKNKADFIEAVTRAGGDGEAITKAYLNNVPKGKRNVKDLSELLSDPAIDLTDLVTSSDKLIKEATEIAAGRQTIGQAVGIAAVGSAQAQRQGAQ